MSKFEEDVYSPDADRKRVLSTFENRVHLLNCCERSINKNYIPKTIEYTGINTNNKDEMVNYILSTNKRIDEIREYMKQNGTSIQKHKLNTPLME